MHTFPEATSEQNEQGGPRVPCSQPARTAPGPITHTRRVLLRMTRMSGSWAAWGPGHPTLDKAHLTFFAGPMPSHAHLDTPAWDGGAGGGNRRLPRRQVAAGAEGSGQGTQSWSVESRGHVLVTEMWLSDRHGNATCRG